MCTNVVAMQLVHLLRLGVLFWADVQAGHQEDCEQNRADPCTCPGC